MHLLEQLKIFPPLSQGKIPNSYQHLFMVPSCGLPGDNDPG